MSLMQFIAEIKKGKGSVVHKKALIMERIHGDSEKMEVDENV